MRAGPFCCGMVGAMVCPGFSPVALADPASGRFDAMLERPLFSPTRRPPPKPADAPTFAPLAPPAAMPLPPPPITLSGVITGGGIGVALLRRPQDTAPIRVALGGQVDGWTLAEIRPRAIVLRRETRTVTVELPLPPR